MHTPMLTASFGDEASHAQIARLARAPGATVVAYHELGANNDGVVVRCAEHGVCTVAPATAAHA